VAKPLREARPQAPGGFFFAIRACCPPRLYLPRLTSLKKLSRGVDANFLTIHTDSMDNLVLYGLIALAIGFFLGLLPSLYAIARLSKFERSVRDLDWQSLADLTIDVQKLKKNAQKYQQNVNAAQKLTQKEKLAMAIEQQQMRAQPNVMPLTNREM
jgi:hypothetical protein